MDAKKNTSIQVLLVLLALFGLTNCKQEDSTPTPAPVVVVPVSIDDKVSTEWVTDTDILKVIGISVEKISGKSVKSYVPEITKNTTEPYSGYIGKATNEDAKLITDARKANKYIEFNSVLKYAPDVYSSETYTNPQTKKVSKITYLINISTGGAIKAAVDSDFATVKAYTPLLRWNYGF